ncbi:tRNA 2-selenouridine(34) synthase MnmH [Comamonas piscis]|uniref:tRNA 2-selenouridine(34) synthase MnmH n=1 Tax=Comamonas piscis TaxID=1562974 RepID=A0A7G5EJ54_9BURK|nr:tRNA 2-selenouridine(34) synthase MnmH [Comamonas piscis]QMV74029.1 tRNA 2-selenouridine(34) synthase MnmH [Comamonas piscis]WSO32459.1 tRNA 2-selenouridine(34) synthase MnmH [Comamonas piscis]
MSHRQPVRISDIAQFHTIVDARSPAEFALDRIPGAINCPVLSDEERAEIGTIYKQVSPFEAKRLGAAYVSANLARHLHDTFHDRPANWKPLVYCWRGGLRSGSMVTWLRLVGWDAQQLAGGYKGFRGHVIEQIDSLVPRLQLRVLCGATGSAKTRVLHALAAQGAQVMDLEGYASHKGSLLGHLPGVEQPSQKHFETLMATQMAQFDLSRPVYIEGESAKIGRIAVPLALVDRMRQAPIIEIDASVPARLAYLLRDYAYLGADAGLLATKLGYLKELQGKEVVGRWQGWAAQGALEPLFSELMALHYDPHYERSQARNFAQWALRQTLLADDLSDSSIDQLAAQIRQRDL